MKNAAVSVREATSGQDMLAARRLFQDYATWLGIDLSFQSFEQELATLPGYYAPPSGSILLAECDRIAIGCVALRELGDGAGEVKRLYVNPHCQGTGTGRRLMERIIFEARRIGYSSLRLDTIPRMAAAQHLYRSLGFKPIPAYYDSPIAGTTYMELSLPA